MKYFKIMVFILVTSVNSFGQLQYLESQTYVSPIVSFGMPAIIKQNNYGYAEMAYLMKSGMQAGILIGYDNYLKTGLRFGLIYSRNGQIYRDVLHGLTHRKAVTLHYINLPVVYRYIFGDTRSFDMDGVHNYIFGGVQLGYLIKADIKWERDGTEIDFWDFVSYINVNPNLDQIKKNGIPESDNEFFTKFDIGLAAGYGMHYFLQRNLSIFGEVYANLGIQDINAPSWRFRNRLSSYRPSYNFYAGFGFGVNYYLR
jgi:hypothetical protein